MGHLLLMKAFVWYLHLAEIYDDMRSSISLLDRSIDRSVDSACYFPSVF
jgi:hypothetical protein